MDSLHLLMDMVKVYGDANKWPWCIPQCESAFLNAVTAQLLHNLRK